MGNEVLGANKYNRLNYEKNKQKAILFHALWIPIGSALMYPVSYVLAKPLYWYLFISSDLIGFKTFRMTIFFLGLVALIGNAIIEIRRMKEANKDVPA